MAKVCGIEIKGSTAIVVVLEGGATDFKVIPTEFKKLNLADSTNQAEVKVFYQKLTDFFEAYQFDKIGIKARGTKGKFAGGATTFKIEGLIQLAAKTSVILMHGATIKAKVKKVTVVFEGVNSYQLEAMRLGYCLL